MEDRAPGPEFLVVGHLSKPHGNKGELMVWPLTDRPDEVLAAGREVVAGDENGEPGDAPLELVVESARPYRKGVLLKFEGVDDRTAAEMLAARYLLVPAASLDDGDEDALYYHELLGLVVETAAGERVGRVREVYETEPSHLLEVKGEGRVHLVPFTRRIVKRIDREGGRLVIEPPEGLLDL